MKILAVDFEFNSIKVQCDISNQILTLTVKKESFTQETQQKLRYFQSI